MNFTILISSVGRRAQLVDCWRTSCTRLGLQPRVLGIDVSASAPAVYLVDEWFKVPNCGNRSFLEQVLDLCRTHDVRLIVPTIDPELAVYAANAAAFRDAGTMVLVSTPDVIKICGDKVATHRWLVDNRFPCVRQAGIQDVLRQTLDWKLPVIVKPRFGSASIGVQLIHSREALQQLAGQPGEWLVEERANGVEYTINVLADRRGKAICAVPHRRLEVRSGEVSKGVTCRHPELVPMAMAVVNALPGAYGSLNVQCFLQGDGSIRVTEINGRFGGGFPLAYHAGADFPRWIMEELLELPSTASSMKWENDLAMLRYDNAVFVSNATAQGIC